MTFSIGTALVDARDHQLAVDLLAEGHWLHGLVTGVDSFGVVLEREDGSHSVVRLECVSAVEVDPSGSSRRGDARDGQSPVSRPGHASFVLHPRPPRGRACRRRLR